MNIHNIRQELAIVDDVPPLEGQRYATCLQSYEEASNQRARILDWFTGHVIPKLPKDCASFLSVGCGAGVLDKKILAAGKEHASSISYIGLEPDPYQCERFIARMVSEGDRNIRVGVHNTSFEEFTGQDRFDLVLMVHSLYYMEDAKTAILHALNLVNESGRLAVLIASNDTLNELSSSFWGREKRGSTWFSEDLREYLEKLGVPFECKRIEARLDITSCCEPRSENGARIADFLAQVPIEDLPMRLRQMIFSYIEATSHRDGDKRYLAHNVDAFVIETGQTDAAGGLLAPE